MSVIQIAHNAVKARLIDAPREVKLRVSSLLSYRVEGAEHMASFKSHSWDGRSSFFDFRKAMFPAGFVNMVHSTLIKEGHKVQLLRKPLPEPLGEKSPKVDAFDPDPRYDYQEKTISKLLKHGQMIARVATGGGKSRIAKLAFATIKRDTLFLTTRSVLMYQMADAFKEDMGIDVGVIGDGNWNPKKGMNVAMVQSIAPYVERKSIESEVERLIVNKHNADKKAIDDLRLALKKEKAEAPEINKRIARLRKDLKAKDLSIKALTAKVVKTVDAHNKKADQVAKVLERFEFVIAEEAHEASGDSFYNIMCACKNAHYRLALTATPFMKTDEAANMRLMACSGPIGIHITEELLIDRGILAKPYFKIANIPAPSESTPNFKKLARGTPWQRAYKLGIAENEYRNAIIVKECKRAVKHGLTGMVLVQHKAHGHTLQQMMTKVGIRAEFIYGKHEQEQRKSALKRLASGEIDILIGSVILDVGVDVPAVGLVVLGGGGKAETALRQRIGRGLRAKKRGPNVCLILDFADDRNSHLKEHALQRRAIIESTPGFAENILPRGADFDYVELGIAA